jgi:hypothetical protein
MLSTDLTLAASKIDAGLLANFIQMVAGFRVDGSAENLRQKAFVQRVVPATCM